MELLLFLLVSFAVLFSGYLVVGRLLARMFHLSRDASTPAHAMRDGLDFEPARTSCLLPQHFSAIAAAGPIVGPILAGIYFGWGPAWLWILIGSIFIGGIHDFTALVASIRHQAKSIAEVVRQYMNPRAYVLFLVFIWSALVYVIIAFTDVTAGTFVAQASKIGADAPGPAVATSSFLYLGLAVLMGISLRFTKIGPVRAKLIFLPLVIVSILIGPYIPLDLCSILGKNKDQVQQIWGYLLLGYCFFAAMAPVWSLLQPRGELGGYFLYIVMGIAVIGIGIGAVTGGLHIEQPFFKGWEYTDKVAGAWPLFPILFITVACGACSGFHSIVSSGTTSKQIDHETDARPVAYGGMLLEGFFACLSLATLMVISKSDLANGPNWIYAHGIADFGNRIVAPFLPKGVSVFDLLFQFGLLCFATFVFDTLDACTRLARYVLMELLGWKSRWQAAAATLISLIVPVIAISLPRVELAGKAQPLWQVFWSIFGSSNQLLAALTLLAVTVWLARKKMAWWVTLGPTVFMMFMTIWSLLIGARSYLTLFRSGARIETIRHFQFGIIVSLTILAVWLVIEAVITARDIISAPPPTVAVESPEPLEVEHIA